MKSSVQMAIIRPLGIPLPRNFYNSQEIGLARGLSKIGINVDVYVAGEDSKVVCRDIETSGIGSVRLFELPFLKLPLIDQAVYPKLPHLLRAGNYSFIQVNEENELTSFGVARFARKNNIPVVVYQGMYKQLSGRIYGLFQKFYDRFLLPNFRENIDLALVKTTRAGDHLRRKGFKKIKRLPVGLDPTPFLNQQDKDWRSEFNIPQDDSIILYVGIFEKRRNVDFMLDLAKDLQQKGITLIMAGAGPEHARITDRINDEQIANVRLVGMVAQNNIPSLYRSSSLFLLPSNYEIYGMVVIEAMYFGVPVISTRTAGPEDIIENEIDGILMDSLDVETWGKAILNSLFDPKKLEEMNTNSRNKIRSKFLWDIIAQDYSENVIKIR